MAQVFEQVCNRCGAGYDPKGDARWSKSPADKLWCHLCPDSYYGRLVEVDITQEELPTLNVDGPYVLLKNSPGTIADLSDARAKMAAGLLAEWTARGFMIDMSEDEEAPVKFYATAHPGGPRTTVSADVMTGLRNPPNDTDAELMMMFEAELRGVLASRRLLRPAKKKPEPAGGGIAKASGGSSPSINTKRVSGIQTPDPFGRTSGQNAPTGVDFDAPPRFATLGFLGIREAIHESGTIPPITVCPSCGATEVFRFWEQPLNLSDASGVVTIPIIYHCPRCLRDDLYGEAIPMKGPDGRTVTGHKSTMAYPHVATCWPDQDYRPLEFRAPSTEIVLAARAAADLEITIDEMSVEPQTEEDD